MHNKSLAVSVAAFILGFASATVLARLEATGATTFDLTRETARPTHPFLNFENSRIDERVLHEKMEQPVKAARDAVIPNWDDARSTAKIDAIDAGIVDRGRMQVQCDQLWGARSVDGDSMIIVAEAYGRQIGFWRVPIVSPPDK